MSSSYLLEVHVKPNSRTESVEFHGSNSCTVKVNAVPEDGKANRRATELLARALNLPKSKIQLIRGAKSRNKVFQVNSNER